VVTVEDDTETTLTLDFDVVDDQELIVVLELGGQLPTGVGPPGRRQEDAYRWAVGSWRWLLVMR
jgi:hypothetical protein